MASIIPVRPSPIAGTWYEGNPGILAKNVDQYLDEAELPELPGEVVSLIAPHAGHVYSGPVAGYAFATVRGRQYDLVVILSPMHHPYREALLTSAHEAYGTPLGEVMVDQAAVADLNARLEKADGFGLTPVAYDREHSLEIELPFLQRALSGSFKLLPVMVRSQSLQVCLALGTCLAGTLRSRNALLVASTDLSHFYPQTEARILDAEMLRRIESFSPELVLRAEKEDIAFACGAGAVAASLWAARSLGADSARILHYASSGDITGDRSSVVGYGAAVTLKTS